MPPEKYEFDGMSVGLDGEEQLTGLHIVARPAKQVLRGPRILFSPGRVNRPGARPPDGRRLDAQSAVRRRRGGRREGGKESQSQSGFTVKSS